LQATAFREAEEELGGLPPLHVAGSYLTTRGKVRASVQGTAPAPLAPPDAPHLLPRPQRGQKHYTVFVCDIVGEETFMPVLNHEHRESRFFTSEALRAAVRPTPFPPSPPAPLHPVVDALLRQHPTALAARQ
jgi:8-oxo-dGTP pyrophosphatase MutT (NUDIX family)